MMTWTTTDDNVKAKNITKAKTMNTDVVWHEKVRKINRLLSTIVYCVINSLCHGLFTHYTQGVYKQWNGILEWWNTGMEFFKVQYHFLHPNKYNSSPYVSK